MLVESGSDCKTNRIDIRGRDQAEFGSLFVIACEFGRALAGYPRNIRETRRPLPPECATQRAGLRPREHGHAASRNRAKAWPAEHVSGGIPGVLWIMNRLAGP